MRHSHFVDQNILISFPPSNFNTSLLMTREAIAAENKREREREKQKHLEERLMLAKEKKNQVTIERAKKRKREERERQLAHGGDGDNAQGYEGIYITITSYFPTLMYCTQYGKISLLVSRMLVHAMVLF